MKKIFLIPVLFFLFCSAFAANGIHQSTGSNRYELGTDRDALCDSGWSKAWEQNGTTVSYYCEASCTVGAQFGVGYVQIRPDGYIDHGLVGYDGGVDSINMVTYFDSGSEAFCEAACDSYVDAHHAYHPALTEAQSATYAKTGRVTGIPISMKCNLVGTGYKYRQSDLPPAPNFSGSNFSDALPAITGDSSSSSGSSEGSSSGSQSGSSSGSTSGGNSSSGSSSGSTSGGNSSSGSGSGDDYPGHDRDLDFNDASRDISDAVKKFGEYLSSDDWKIFSLPDLSFHMPIPSGSCSSVVLLPNYSLDVCPALARARAFLSWIYVFLTGYVIWLVAVNTVSRNVK